MSNITGIDSDIKKRKDQEASYKELIFFFLPLAVTSFLVVITHSLFNAGLSRLPTPEVYISAFAVVKSLTNIFQSPINMTKQTVFVLMDDEYSYRKTRLFLTIVVLCVVVSLGIIAMTDLSRWVLSHIMGLSGKTLDAAVSMLRIAFIFPGMVGVRDYFTGIALKFKLTPLVTLGSLMRIVYVSVFISFLNGITALSGAALAGIMFAGAAATEALVLFVGTKLTVKNIPNNLMKNSRESSTRTKLTYKSILKFFMPLAVTVWIHTSAMPIINSALARTYQPEIAISVFAVGWGLGLIFLSPFTVFHQLPLQFIDQKTGANMKRIVKMAAFLGLFFSLSMVVVSFTDIGYYILKNMIGTTHEISVLALDILKLMSVLPILIVVREFIWGILMKNRMTKAIAKGKTINMLVMVIVIIVMCLIAPSNPAIIGVVGMIGCTFSESVYLCYVLNFKKDK